MKFTFPKVSWNKTWTTPVLFVGGIVLGAVLAVGVVFAVRPELFPSSPTAHNQPPTVPVPTDGGNPASPTMGDVTALQMDTRSMALNVNWHDPTVLTRQEIRDLFLGVTTDTIAIYEAMDKEDIRLLERGKEYAGMWEAGTVRDGEWKDAEVYVLRLTEEGMGIYYRHFHIIKPKGSNTLYAVTDVIPMSVFENKDELRYWLENMPIIKYLHYLPNVSLTGADMPNTITLQDGSNIVKTTPHLGGGWGDQYVNIDVSQPYSPLTYSKDRFPIYPYQFDLGTSEDGKPIDAGCLMLFGADGKVHVYKTSIEGAIRWKPGFENTDGYLDSHYGGCGAAGCLDIISETTMRAGGELVAVGTTSDGKEIFAPKNPTSYPLVKAAYDTWYDQTWGEYTWDENGIRSVKKPPIEEFLKKYPVPIYFWQDGLGRWITHTSTITLPPAECGKPVIYLYPEKTTNVSVRLPSFINVTVSDPAYPAGGWHVTAQPDGTLTDSRDGRTYGSLYWEGTGVGYGTPEDGWVVKDGEVSSFLASTLPRYGLNEQETKDFMEFWVSEMVGAPYYRVSFLTTEWSKAAPLGVTPRPTTAIRIFMDWKPLAAPITIAAPTITAPAREGFTLVEWGGTLWK